IPRLRIRSFETFAEADADVEHDAIDAAELFIGTRDELFARSLVADIGSDHDSLAAARSDSLLSRSRRRRISIDARNRRTFNRTQKRNRTPVARRRIALITRLHARSDDQNLSVTQSIAPRCFALRFGR